MITSTDDKEAVSRTATSTNTPCDPHKACKICGDKANGFNFGVLSCESCKAFFRRNAAKADEISCPFTGSCGITSASRRYCQACRLKKCLDVGMRSDWLNDQKPQHPKRIRKKTKVEQKESDDEVSVSKTYLQDLIKKAKRSQKCCECTCSCGFYSVGTRLTALYSKDMSIPSPSSYSGNQSVSSPSSPPFVNTPQSVPSTTQWSPMDPSACSSSQPLLPPPPAPPFQYSFPLQQSVLSLSASEASLLNTNMDYCSNFYPHSDPQSLHKFPGNPLLHDQPIPLVSVNNFNRLFEMSRSNPHTTPVVDKYAQLNREDMTLLQELLQAGQPLNSPMDMDLSSILSLMDVVKITEFALRRFVCMVRDLSMFRVLPYNDKVVLMKACCGQLMILRGAMAYDPQRKSWAHGLMQSQGPMEVKLDVLKYFNPDRKHYDEHKRFLEGLDERARKTESVIMVLMAITIFQHDGRHLESKEYVVDTQQKYKNLLKKVLVCEVGAIEAPKVYQNLTESLADLRQINQGLLRIYYGFDSAALDPLIKELFDI